MKSKQFPAFQNMLRIVFGGNIARAKTDTERTIYLRRFLEELESGHDLEISWMQGTTKGKDFAGFKATRTIAPPSKDRIDAMVKELQSRTWDEAELEKWNQRIAEWSKSLRKRRGTAGAKARWKKTD